MLPPVQLDAATCSTQCSARDEVCAMFNFILYYRFRRLDFANALDSHCECVPFGVLVRAGHRLLHSRTGPVGNYEKCECVLHFLHGCYTFFYICRFKQCLLLQTKQQRQTKRPWQHCRLVWTGGTDASANSFPEAPPELPRMPNSDGEGILLLQQLHEH